MARRATDLRLINRCLGWAAAECQKHSSERSGAEWAACNEDELNRNGQASRKPY